MQILYLALSLFLLRTLGAGMWRVLRGPGLFETQGVALQGVAACALVYHRHRQTHSDPLELQLQRKTVKKWKRRVFKL